MIECQNFDLGRQGELFKRTGIKRLATLGAGNQTVTVIGYFSTSVFSQIIVKHGNDLYYTTDGATYTLIGTYNDVEHGVQYTDKFYMVRRTSTMLQWDGAAITVIAGSPTGSHCRIYKDRMFVANTYSAANPARVYYSAIANFLTAGWSGLGTFVDVNPGDGDSFVAFAVLHDTFVIFKQYSTWLLYITPDPTGWELRNSNPELGCISKYTAREIEGYLYFLSARGVYKTDGYTFIDISEPVSPIFDQIVLSSALVNQTVGAWWHDKYILMLQTFATPPTWNSFAAGTWDALSVTPWDAANATYTWLVYHLKTNQWTHWLPAGGISAFNMVEIPGPAAIKGLYIGSRALNGRIYRYGDTVYQDDVNSNYDCIVETKDFDFGQAATVKRGLWLGVEKQGVGDLSISNIPDSNQQATAVVSFPVNARTTKRVPGPGFFRDWRVRVTATHDGPITFYGFVLASTSRKKTLAGA